MSSTIKLAPPIAALLISAGFQQFAEEIPNGHRVPNPNPQGGIWAGVGHLKTGGGGTLNPFGEDFKQQGFQWTEDLCQTDSDGDRRTNGVELGDPDCLWSKGDSEESDLLPALSHPGVVDEPLEDASSIKSTCSDYVEPADAIKFDMKFTQPTSIDGSRTHYVCQQIEISVPSAEKLHMTRSSILLDNDKTLHHMFVFFCFGNAASQTTEGNRVGEAPYVCDGAESICTQVATWAIGPSDECLPPNIGKEYDFTGMENVVVKIEAHYDNTLGIPQEDQSGIQITFTPQLRPLVAGMSAWGMDVINKDFVIPPQSERHPLTSICPTEATAKLKEPIYLFQFYPHMHLHGLSMYTEHYRCGKKIGEFAHVTPYEFDNQQKYGLDPAIKILPGDAMVTTCEYKTLDLFNETLTAGLGTDDEMCISIMSFYPRIENDYLLACFSFENGINPNFINPSNMAGGGAAPGTPPDGAGVDPSAMMSILGGRWALTSGNPMTGILQNFSSNPEASWAPCCDAGTCDTAYLATEGSACSADTDCVEGLVCGGGLCGDSGEHDKEGGSASNDEASEGTRTSLTMFFISFAMVLVSLVSTTFDH